MDKKYSREFGIVQVDKNSRVAGFQEKPAVPVTLPSNPHAILINMGVYVFNTEILVKRLIDNAKKKDTQHDFGKNIIPQMIAQDRVFAFPFTDTKTGQVGYWRDVGTLDAYWEASMELLKSRPLFDMYDATWPVLTNEVIGAPAKVEGFGEKDGVMYGSVFNSIISRGCIIRFGHVSETLLSPNVTVDEYAAVKNCILMNGVQVGKHCRIQRAIVDKGVHIPDKTEIGYHPENDKKRFTVTDSGIVVIGKGAAF